MRKCRTRLRPWELVAQIRDKTCLRTSFTIFWFTHMENIRSSNIFYWGFSNIIVRFECFLWRTLIDNSSLHHALYTSSRCARSLMFKCHMDAFVPFAFLAFTLLIEGLSLLFAFFLWTNNLTVPVIYKAGISTLSPLIEKLADFLLPQIVILFLAMKTSLALQVLNWIFNVWWLYFSFFGRIYNWCLILAIILIIYACLFIEISFSWMLKGVIECLLCKYEWHLLIVRPMILQQERFFRLIWWLFC